MSLFITFEGGEGSGKSSVMKEVAKRLAADGYEIIETREPGGTPIAEQIRNVILDKANTKMDARTEALLYAASRRQHLVEKVWPALEEGKIVLCDRFFDSSSAYQGMARGMGMEFVAGLNMAATGGLKPDVTFFFDISAEEALERRGKRGEASDRIELAGLKFQEDVRRGYLELAKESDGRVITIDATKGIDEIFEVVKDSLKGKI